MARKTARKTARKKDVAEAGARKYLLLAALVIVTTTGTIYALGTGKEEAAEEEILIVDTEVLEIAPLIPPGSLSKASWNLNAAPEPEEYEGDETYSVLEEYEARNGGAKRDRSLEKTVSEIHGLGIYVDTGRNQKKE